MTQTNEQRTERTVVITDKAHAKKVVKGIRNKHCNFRVWGQAFLKTTEGKAYDHRFLVAVTRKEFIKTVQQALSAGYREKFTVEIEIDEDDKFTFVSFG